MYEDLISIISISTVTQAHQVLHDPCTKTHKKASASRFGGYMTIQPSVETKESTSDTHNVQQAETQKVQKELPLSLSCLLTFLNTPSSPLVQNPRN